MTIYSDQLRLEGADNSAIESIPFSADPFQARDTLTNWFGTSPTTTEVGGGHYCSETGAPIVVDTWGGGFAMIHSGPSWNELGVAFTLDVSVAEVGGLAIAAPDGSTIGDDPAGLIAALPDLRGAFVEQDPGLDRIYFDSTNADYAAYTYAFAGKGLQQIISPYMLEEYC